MFNSHVPTKVLRAADGYSLADMVQNLDRLMERPETPETIEAIGNDFIEMKTKEICECGGENGEHFCECGQPVAADECSKSNGAPWCMRCMQND